jgi:hypothetical protein
MSEMIERVAMGIHAQRANSRLTKWEDCSEEYRNGTRRDARAAIEAMREPTDEMQSAGYLNAEHSIEAVGDLAPAPESQPRLIWQAMIDAALA